MKNRWERVHISPRHRHTTQMESQQLRPGGQSQVVFRASCVSSLWTCLVSFKTVQFNMQKKTDVDWFMGLSELMAFISITIMRGIIRRHPQRAQTDKFAAILNIWGLFVTNCITSYIPGRHITIDEQLFPSKTRCCFLQYSKPGTFGIRFWVACDLKTKYVCNILPYLGKDPTQPRGERVSESVVMRLMEPFLDKGRNVTTDNFFTSLSLAKQLLSRNTTILGTVNKIPQEIPLSTRQMHRNEFTTQVFSTTGATLTVYAPKWKKTVYVLSSMHSMIQTQDTAKKKPNTITLYNTTKCGVAVMDQMVREYTVRAGTWRWPVAVFYNMIDMAALNAHVLYQLCTGRQEKRVDFLLELARELAQTHVDMTKAQKEQLFRQQPSTPQLGKRAKCQAKIKCKDNHATVRCVDCYRYTCGKCRKEQWQCQDCE
ncbi:hypothetical protein fugu_016001 [Takifugu bimaculatus]|uniref:PiggyBac transposable element-derived protein domain-containing protein n=1 Tax=Takifugu bimaculatus TaxID=433685 RepID=A0A4Z2BY64_9TELE|nr:hypothetical protein fugu_016001 [Takifugu bimaculatus]